MEQEQTNSVHQGEVVANTAPSAAPAAAGVQTQYAGFWIRVVAYIIDAVILGVVNFILTALLGGADGQSPIGTVVSIVIGFAYFTYFESSKKQGTWGKQALGLMVTDVAGHRISFGKASLRWVGKIISGIILGIGFIMVGFTAKKQGLHDMIAGTLVVKK